MVPFAQTFTGDLNHATRPYYLSGVRECLPLEAAMPELYGNPFKSELRRRIAKLKIENAELQRERVVAANKLACAKFKIEELEARLQSLGQKAREIADEASQDTTDAVKARIINSIERRRVA